MQTYSLQSIAPKAIWNAEMPTQYRFAWVAENQMQERLQTVLENTGLTGWTKIHSENLVIEIARFEALSRLEDTLARWTQRICSEQVSIDLVVNNLSGTPSHTVFARILDPTQLKKLVGQLRKLDLYLTGNGQQPLYSFNRFWLTVADRVHAEGFENLLYRLGRVEFSEQIQIKKLLLQKKEMQSWITVRQFYFSEQA